MFIKQKSQEISLALVKVSVYIRRADFRQRLERLAFQLLEDTASRDFERALSTTDIIWALVTLGKTIYEIEPINAKILLQELDSLNAAIRQSAGLEGLPDLGTVFSKLPVVVEKEAISGNKSDVDSGNDDICLRVGMDNGNGNGNNNGINGTIRQSAIIEKIRQSGKIALKDILAAFPDVSERTLRYDLQKLCNQAILERIGNGGPASFYVFRS
ncbi:MAG: hypothetical protein A2745_00325 [Candidatus Harrisonbacteria bacterium RIFCSPHIGHO2_01_FULL_44_13]|uniref:HTH deoR-type domain-containing protein n=1 Tax=Candidatus Harrisonbacteria bacterium RIFCSPLOWO2_01_FULL_44_18 TaxID=1798407 RepID=A0A1G1ZLE9_9BACT|nr:MAG: hypothetical protein A2745_00325 [Candidatus Harrisonbacteria bacterium RIFCSPHIGHO2_01_FULL_44_13]OGY65371.1 MAG: hypothetical protein A3A16_02900 [Candidatus Harrisonbacteria bacterium RIFCSPLOWO2_01_FULL_44_18]